MFPFPFFIFNSEYKVTQLLSSQVLNVFGATKHSDVAIAMKWNCVFKSPLVYPIFSGMNTIYWHLN